MTDVPTVAGEGLPPRPPYIPLSLCGISLADVTPAQIDAADADTLNGLFAVMVTGYRMVPMPVAARQEVMNPEHCRPMLCPPARGWGINYSIPNPCGRFGTLKQVRALAGEYRAAVVLYLGAVGVHVVIGYDSMAALAASGMMPEGQNVHAKLVAGMGREFVALSQAVVYDEENAIPIALVKAALGFLLSPAIGGLWANAVKADQAQQAAWFARVEAAQGGAP